VEEHVITLPAVVTLILSFLLLLGTIYYQIIMLTVSQWWVQAAVGVLELAESVSLLDSRHGTKNKFPDL